MIYRFDACKRSAMLGMGIWLSAFSLCHARPWIVEDGMPRAQIVIAPDPPRLVRLAAEELREHVLKMTGAELPIIDAPSADYPTTVFVGVSAGTADRGIGVEGLAHGAFRMVSGDDWLALVGLDSDFAPIEPWARNNNDRGRAQAEWEQLTGGTWVNPMNSVYRSRHGPSGIWILDEGGSLQAVYAFLRTLGVRWYMPGELGMVVPQRARIALPEVDRTVTPDYPYRDLRVGNFTQYPWEDVLWHFRLGLNNQGLAAPHGMRRITAGAAMKAQHPEYYALLRGRRDTTTRGSGHACFSSEGLLQETIAYARARFDHFNLPAVSVFPQDGYRHCGCPLCKDKSPSEVVWEFVERVAQALHASHPDRIVLGGAYSSYRDPPDTIEKFSPNVAVRISAMRPGLDDDERWEEYWPMVEAWATRLAPQRLMRNANIQWTASPGFPIIHTRSIARDLGALRGLAIGESSSVPREREQRWQRPGLSHLNIYVLARYMWDARQDLDGLLREYYTLFYGPANDAMRAAFEFAEEVYPREGRPTPNRVGYAARLRFVEMLHAAREIAGDTLYGRRVQTVIDELQPLDVLRELYAVDQARGDVPEFTRMHNMAGNSKWHAASRTFQLDGRLDEPFWTAYHSGATLADIKTGRRPDNSTRFYLKWYQGALYIGIRCDDRDMAGLNAATDRDQDESIFLGDCVTLLLETQDLSYYQITFNPAGAVWDADRSEDGAGEHWSSQAEVATSVADDHWIIEARIPVTRQDDDPLHQVVGSMPTRSFPWYINVCRRRVRGDDVEMTAWVPTDKDDCHDRLKFGKLFERHSR